MYSNTIFTQKPIVHRTVGFFRLLHAVPNAPNVDAYVNDKLIINELTYSQYTAYMPMLEGTYKISLYVAGTKDTPVLSNMLTVNDNDILTVATSGTLNSMGFMAFPNVNVPMEPSKAMICFTHLSPNAPSLDITLPDGTILFNSVGFRQVSPYIAVTPSNYTLQVKLTGFPNVILTVPNIILEPNKCYTVYALGLLGNKPGIQALHVLDSNDYINFHIKTC